MVIKLSGAARPICLTLRPSVHWQLLCWCSLYQKQILGFRQWRSRADRVLTLKMNIQLERRRLPLLWSTWSRAQGPDSATCAGLSGLAHGRDYSDCGAEQKSKKALGPYFSLNCRIFLKRRANREGFSTLTPQPESVAMLWIKKSHSTSWSTEE